ncbi:hypothetical protein E2P86_12420 [Sphingobacterium psychroaquaticum]|uniref:6-bladed beta-propeller n=1 Tax=Sphingobacterium psychroaquaticum TaxID=561061 RepID=UPI00106A0473|nr:6-bladed beta-propeller [Sphingobacterium psychroaquaticum]QBQ41915.1 hypothetical protein E2P86_12420 [Sphingobacterium psychroaquaticum]
MKRNLLITLLLLSTLACYAQRLIHDPSIPIQKFRIIIEQLRGGTVSENLTDLTYIPLGGTKNDVIDYIASSVFTKERIAIVNNENGHLFLYDEKGNLIKRISKIDGYKPKDKRVFYGVQREGNKLILFGELLKATLDFDGNILEKDIDYKYKTERPIVTLGETTYTYGRTEVKKDSFPEFALKMNDQILVRYDTRDTVSNIFSQGTPLVKISDTKAFAIFPTTYNFFELSPDGISKIHQFLFPLKNTIDTSNFQVYKSGQKLFEYLNKNQEKVYGVGQPLLYKNYLILQIGSLKLAAWVAYDINRGEIISLNKILPDVSNDFLEFLDRNTLTTDGEYLYSIIYPNAIPRAKDKSRNEGHSMRNEYAKLEKSLNPILVRFKLN